MKTRLDLGAKLKAFLFRLFPNLPGMGLYPVCLYRIRTERWSGEYFINGDTKMIYVALSSELLLIKMIEPDVISLPL